MPPCFFSRLFKFIQFGFQGVNLFLKASFIVHGRLPQYDELSIQFPDSRFQSMDSFQVSYLERLGSERTALYTVRLGCRWVSTLYHRKKHSSPSFVSVLGVVWQIPSRFTERGWLGHYRQIYAFGGDEQLEESDVDVLTVAEEVGKGRDTP